MKESGMKKYLIVILFLLLNTTIAFSGEIYGTIKKDGKPIAEGSEIKLEMLTSGKTYSSKCAQYGSYSLYVPGKGRGLLIIRNEELMSEPILIYIYENAIQYDFVLEEKNGSFLARRR
ncbi:hypothetical protein KsCSTR_31020 [Candidatus Kuenenia stuttgartiensis]|jgi:hypothetical protein|uniref:Carboxypeptidase regulatory-like domain-containing protein n=2 Tax=Kuenenia stuttgartiensis TaxID=174633 RepID=A0A6G7GSQ9_KUEST|nr:MULTISPECIES: hypothetical protein [Kuenenia]MBE7547070.1 hypothetical protein [Planctomycetia bacterium]MBZ0193208.1 hypothetical protein [Candidatus Kuenenia stuttgartiensis]MCZ7624173.1 hypothetical protein [Candidatus Kuenenia sp.]QII12481.1 hypothetical protein KsCSTR_31020 [Candidatus Kuenenia stuttgartiensis]GJQ51110.1 MAG: hypothetical protein HKUEN01_34960 [Candidatus Kuenenia stuttgartiensis]